MLQHEHVQQNQKYNLVYWSL